MTDLHQFRMPAAMESPEQIGPPRNLTEAGRELGPGYRTPRGGGGVTSKKPSSSKLRAPASQLQFYYKIEVKLSQARSSELYLAAPDSTPDLPTYSLHMTQPVEPDPPSTGSGAPS